MKNLFTLLFLVGSLCFYGQEEQKESDVLEKTSVKVSSISYEVDKINELDSIDWENVKDVFKYNKPEEIIELTFQLKLKESKNKLKTTFKVSGETKNLEDLIKKSKKGIKSLKKISKKYNKQNH